jgi:hypothetical protein
MEAGAQAIHEILAVAAIGAVVVGLVWAAVLALTGSSGGGLPGRFQAVLIGVILVAAIAGAAVFVTGARPADGLHVVYGAVAVLLIPFARSFVGGGTRRDRVIMLVAVVALGGVMYRLVATG